MIAVTYDLKLNNQNNNKDGKKQVYPPTLEAMAKNVHEIWAQERINQGWTYGEKRDDAQKHHPCLIAYEDLPDEEKVYDRNTSVETLKLILKLGFKIKKK